MQSRVTTPKVLKVLTDAIEIIRLKAVVPVAPDESEVIAFFDRHVEVWLIPS
jgi:hypothetical protein